jgi:Rod binding domain-containing protein
MSAVPRVPHAAIHAPNPEPKAASHSQPSALTRAAKEFEAVFVKELLREAHMGDQAGAYADMGVDAMAMAVEAAGGLGLASTIEHSVTGPPAPPDSKKEQTD